MDFLSFSDRFNFLWGKFFSQVLQYLGCRKHNFFLFFLFKLTRPKKREEKKSKKLLKNRNTFYSWACFVLKQKRLPWTFTFQKNYFYCVKRAPETSKHNGTNMCKFLLRRRHHVGLAMVPFMSHDHCYYKLCFSFFVFCIYHSWLIGVLLDLLTSSTDLKFKSICSHLSKAFVGLSKI